MVANPIPKKTRIWKKINSFYELFETILGQLSTKFLEHLENFILEKTICPTLVFIAVSIFLTKIRNFFIFPTTLSNYIFLLSNIMLAERDVIGNSQYFFKKKNFYVFLPKNFSPQ